MVDPHEKIQIEGKYLPIDWKSDFPAVNGDKNRLMFSYGRCKWDTVNAGKDDNGKECGRTNMGGWTKPPWTFKCSGVGDKAVSYLPKMSREIDEG